MIVKTSSKGIAVAMKLLLHIDNPDITIKSGISHVHIDDSLATLLSVTANATIGPLVKREAPFDGITDEEVEVMQAILLSCNPVCNRVEGTIDLSANLNTKKMLDFLDMVYLAFFPGKAPAPKPDPNSTLQDDDGIGYFDSEGYHTNG